MPKLVRLDSNEEVEITVAGTVVGRERGCDVLLRSVKVSRQHARFNLREKIPCVEDLGSSNGTKVNGIKIKAITELRTGDKVEFGEYTFQLVDEIPNVADVATQVADVIPQTADTNPKTDGVIPFVDNDISNPDVISDVRDVIPSADKVVLLAAPVIPKTDGVIPLVDDDISNPDGIIPCFHGVIPRDDKVVLLAAAVISNTDGVIPLPADIISDDDGPTPTSADAIPETDGVRQGVSPLSAVSANNDGKEVALPRNEVEFIGPVTKSLSPDRQNGTKKRKIEEVGETSPQRNSEMAEASKVGADSVRNELKKPSKRKKTKPKVVAPSNSKPMRSMTREACAALLAFLSIIGFVLGRTAYGLGLVELPGESAAKEILIAKLQAEAQAFLAPAVPQAIAVREFQQQPTRPFEASSLQERKPEIKPEIKPERKQDVSVRPIPAANENHKNKISFPNVESVSDDSIKPGEMSLSDSAKAVKLLRDAKRAGIDLRDIDAATKFATETLGIPTDQARRVAKFAKVMSDRKAIMDGGIDSVFNEIEQSQDKPRPAPASPKFPPKLPQRNPAASAAENPDAAVVRSGAPILNPNAGNTVQKVTDNQISEKMDSLLEDIVNPPKAEEAEADAKETEPIDKISEPTAEKSEPVATPLPVSVNVQTPTVVPMVVLDEPRFPAVKKSPKRGPGYYMNVWGMALVFGLLMAWLNGVHWMGRDISVLGFQDTFWLRLSCVAGPLGAILALCSPDLGLGIMLNSACMGAPFLGYIAIRDERVPRGSRVLQFLKWFEPEGVEETLLEPVPLRVEFLESEGVEGKPGKTRSAQFDEAPGVREAKELISSAFASRASDIHLEPESQEWRSKFHIDGVMHRKESIPIISGRALVDVFKFVGSMDIKETRRPQTGTFRVKVGEVALKILAASQRTPNGEKLSLKLLCDQEELSNLAGIGCNRKIQGEIRDIVSQPRGLFLVCSSAGGGKSTTLRSALSELDPSTLNIVTIENPIEHQIVGAMQIEVNWKAGQTFSTTLQSAFQKNPNVLMVGEIRDRETAMAACQAAKCGHLVLSTIVANDALTAIQCLSDMGTDSLLLSDTLSAILGQRLVRRLCRECKTSYRPDTELLRRYRISSDREIVFFRPPDGESKCEKCGGVGYRGRIGIFELLKINDNIRTLIGERAPSSQIKTAARRSGMVTLREDGFRQAIRGGTSLDEILGALHDS